MNTIVSTAMVMAVTSGVLALLLTVGNKYIVTYGKVKLTINNEIEHIVEGGKSLIESLNASGILIRTACGGKGTCGSCKIKVISGGGDILPTEKGSLSPANIKDGFRLACQLKVFNDISILLPTEMLQAEQYECVVENIENLTENIKAIRLKLPEKNKFKFKPGQYIQFFSPIYPGSNTEVYRNYSIASSNSQNDYIDLYVKYVPNGICTTYMHNYLRLGDTITISGPYGEFYYHKGKGQILMVCTGSGFAPLRSILEYIKENKIDREVMMVYGSKTERDIYDDTIFNEFKDMNVKFNICVSEPTDGCNWSGNVGRVTEFVNERVKDVSELDVYLCGSRNMVNGVKKLLLKKGVPNDRIYFDRF